MNSKELFNKCSGLMVQYLLLKCSIVKLWSSRKRKYSHKKNLLLTVEKAKCYMLFHIESQHSKDLEDLKYENFRRDLTCPKIVWLEQWHRNLALKTKPELKQETLALKYSYWKKRQRCETTNQTKCVTEVTKLKKIKKIKTKHWKETDMKTKIRRLKNTSK